MRQSHSRKRHFGNIGSFIRMPMCCDRAAKSPWSHGYDGKEKPRSQDIIDILRTGLMDDAAAAKVRAKAIVYDVRVQLPAGEKSDAIAVALDHCDGFSCIMLFPYSIRWEKLKIGTPIRNESPLSVFGSLPAKVHCLFLSAVFFKLSRLSVPKAVVHHRRHWVDTGQMAVTAFASVSERPTRAGGHR